MFEVNVLLCFFPIDTGYGGFIILLLCNTEKLSSMEIPKYNNSDASQTNLYQSGVL